MPYSPQTVYLINKGPKNLGNQLGRIAVRLDFSVMRVSKVTGASRQTVYNWMAGNEVLTPYRPLVDRLIAILNTSATADIAWARACTEFSIQA